MCGRYTLTKLDGFSLFFEIDEKPGLTARYNIGPTQDVVVVRQTQPGRRRLAWMMWGLQPSWNSPGSGRGWINARSESVHRKPAFRDAFLRRRCLIPADGFYEWKQEAQLRRPFHFRLKDSGLFAFAGIWDVGRVAGEAMENCAILTTQSNSLIAPVHDRMPLILPKDSWRLWLRPRTETDLLTRLLVPYPAEEMRKVEVRSGVNSPHQEGPQCLQPAPQWKQPQGHLFE